MHVTLVAGFDAAGPSAGGTRAYAEGLSGFLSSEGVLHVVVSAGTRGRVSGSRYEVPTRRRDSSLSFQLATCAQMRDLPMPRETIVHAQRPEMLIPFAVARRGRARVCTLHGSPARGIEDRRGRFVGATYRKVERLALSRADRVIAVDAGTANEYRNRYPWLADRLLVIPNGVDSTIFHPMDRGEAKASWDVQGPAFLYAGRLEPEKRVVEIVQVFRSVCDGNAVLLIAGEGSQKSLIKHTAQGIPVRFLGDIPRSRMPSLLNAAEAVVLFSIREGLPMVALEALACGTPVIATAAGDLRSLIRHGETGYLVSSPSQLELAMRDVLDGKLRAAPSIATSVAHYDWREIGLRILQLYEEVWNARVP